MFIAFLKILSTRARRSIAMSFVLFACISACGKRTDTPTGEDIVIKKSENSTDRKIGPGDILLVDLSPPAPTVELGGKIQFTATTILGDKSRSDASARATFSSGDPTVLKMEGNIGTALKIGTSLVNATVDGIDGYVLVMVKQLNITSVNIEPPELTMLTGMSSNLKVFAVFDDGSRREVTPFASWQSTIPVVAASAPTPTAAGAIQAQNAGDTELSAKYLGRDGKAKIHVTASAVNGLDIQSISDSISVGSSQLFKAIANTQDGQHADVTGLATFSVSKPTIAALSSNSSLHGVVLGVSAGTTNISVEYKGQTKVAPLTVKASTLSSVEIKSDSLGGLTPSVTLGSTIKLRAVAKFSDNTEVDVTKDGIWESSTLQTAIVSNDYSGAGIVSTLTAGDTTISITFGAKKTPYALKVASDPTKPSPGDPGQGVSQPGTGSANPPTPAAGSMALLTIVGSGKVVSSPAGIDCPGDCNEPFPVGAVVRLTASPLNGAVFQGWSKGCTGTGVCSFVVNKDTQPVVASFESKPKPATPGGQPTPASPTEVSLSVSSAGPGSVTSSVGGIDCGAQCSAKFPAGSVIVLISHPQPGMQLTGWSGACSGNFYQCQVSLNANAAVTAIFAPALQVEAVLNYDGGLDTITYESLNGHPLASRVSVELSVQCQLPVVTALTVNEGKVTLFSNDVTGATGKAVYTIDNGPVEISTIVVTLNSGGTCPLTIKSER